MRLAAAALLCTSVLALAPAPAHAGGLGVLVTGGAHSERLWFHSNAVTDGEKNVVLVSDPREYEKFEMVQTLPHGGAGFELIMGDRDDRILGSFRIFWMADAPQADPATASDDVNPGKLCSDLGDEAPEDCDKDTVVIRAFRDEAKHIGMGLVGLSWGIVGNPDTFQLGVVGHVGTGFMTNDHTEFLAADLGPGVTYRFARQVQAFADTGYQVRYRKGFSHGVHLTAGVRYLFD